MKTRSLLALSILILLLASACDGEAHAVVRAVDTMGAPLEGVRIELELGGAYGLAKLTDANGCADLGGTTSPLAREVVLTAHLSGYKEYRASIPTMQVWRSTIVLERIGAEEPTRERDRDDHGCPPMAGNYVR